MDNKILHLKNISKTFKKVKALNQINLTVNNGDTLALIGNNGSGKSTLLNIITGLYYPDQDSGFLEIYGEKSPAALPLARRHIAYVGNNYFHPLLSAKQNLQLTAQLQANDNYVEMNNLLHYFELFPYFERPINSLSLGIQQKFRLVAALMAEKSLIILDEPFVYIDPLSCQKLLELLLQKQEKENLTYIISSHNLHLIDKLANRFCFINAGEIKNEISLSELRRRQSNTYNLDTDNNRIALVLLQDINGITNLSLNKDKSLTFSALNLDLKQLNRLLAEHDLYINSLYRRQFDLNDYFQEIMKGENYND